MNKLFESDQWTSRPLVEVATLQRGYDLPVQDRNAGPFPIFAANGPVGFHDTAKCEGPGVVTGRSGTIGKVQFVEGNYWPLNTSLYVTDFHGNHPKWVYYMLQSFGLEKYAQGAGVPTLNRNLVHHEPVLVPPMEEQRRIAAILDQAETLRTQRRTALALLDSLTQSLFLDMFGDPMTNPKKLPLFRGDEICSRITVGIVVQPSSYYRSEGVPALRSLNIRPNKVVMENLVYFSSEDNETKLAKTRVRQGDVLLVRTGQPGTAAVVPPELDGVNAIDILIATPDTSKVSADYLCYFFNSDAGKKLVLGAQRGQVQKHLNVGAMNAALIPIPPLPLQQTFATRIASIEALKATHRRALAALDALFASLQQRAFTGAL